VSDNNSSGGDDDGGGGVNRKVQQPRSLHTHTKQHLLSKQTETFLKKL
jgi:hypothetical protein